MVYSWKKKEELVINAIRSVGECNLNTLRRLTGLSYYTLNRILGNLVMKGIIIEKRVGRLRIFKLVGNQHRA